MSTAALKIVEGGKSGKGRPKKEEVEATRKDTVDKLQALGVLEEVKIYSGKKGWGKPENWNTQRCLKLLKYGRSLAKVPMCECGQPARHFGDKDDPCALCDSCATQAEAKTEGDEKTQAKPQPTAASIMAKFPAHKVVPRESWVFPYFREVVLWERILRAEREAEEAQTLLEIERENMDAVLGPLKSITSDPEYRASLDDIIFVITLDRGRAVRDFRDKCRTLMVDAFNRDEPKYKGKVKLIFKAAYDAKPSENQGASYFVEVKEDLPAFVSGGRLYHNKKGDLLKPAEVFQGLPLGQAGNDGSGASQSA